ncbi:MAG: acylphosphatase [Leptolyngbyaceae cyanobacterium]
MKRVHLIVQGQVQGVGFRHHTQVKAHQLSLNGYVKNLPDGTVEIVAEGDVSLINELIEWVHHGPSAARVKQVDITYDSPQGEFSQFEIAH